MIYGYELIIDLKNCKNISKHSLDSFVIKLCQLIKMKRFRKCQVVYFGKDRFKGFSLMQFLTTSSIVGHFTKDEAFINIFSCKRYNVREAVRFTCEWFETNQFRSEFLRR